MKGGKSLRTDSASKTHSCSNTRREVRGRVLVGIQRGMVFPRGAAEWEGTCWGNICEINYKWDEFTWMDFRWAVTWNEAVLISRRVMWDILAYLETNGGEKQMGNLQRINSGTSCDLTVWTTNWGISGVCLLILTLVYLHLPLFAKDFVLAFLTVYTIYLSLKHTLSWTESWWILSPCREYSLNGMCRSTCTHNIRKIHSN